MTVTTKPDHRGEREGNRKTIARGMPGVSGVTVVTNARVYYTPRAAAGAPSARHSLRPLISGRELHASLGRFASRECEGVFDVIASEAKQSILPHKERMDCFASLAMTI